MKDLYSLLINNMIIWAEKYKKYIPLLSVLIFFLRLPFYIKVLTSIVLGGFFVKIAYEVGFIISQSRAKNEILSVITAYQNPVTFTHDISLRYSFIYFFLVFVSFTPFIALGGYVIFLVVGFGYIRNKKIKPIVLLVLAPIMAVLLFILGSIAYLCLPFLGYIMLYQSKYSSLLELFLRWVTGKGIPETIQSMSYSDFLERVSYSIIYQNWVLFAFVFGLSYVLIWGNKKKPLIKTSLSLVIVTLILSTIILGTIYQPGNFGKSIANYDIDYVRVSYEFNNEVRTIEGIRIFEDRNRIVIRDTCNILYTVQSDTFTSETIVELEYCTK
ncbi:hypothetical protein ACI2LM_08115 [Paenibacillus lautus]|uniref:hypothetical protein n=1 Tax=Paenibacillus lautus TaxID=1401 RepID=UPI00384D4F7D